MRSGFYYYRATCLLLLLGIALIGCSAEAPSRRLPDPDVLKPTLVNYLSSIYTTLSDVKIDEIVDYQDTPFFTARVSFMFQNRPQKTEFYVSEDGKYLFRGELWDLELAPDNALWRRLSNGAEGNREKMDLVGRPTKGNPDASVVVVEYSDYQCPFCAKAYDGLEKQVMDQYGDKIRLVFKHLPLTSIHPWAMKASIAAACGYVQNNDAFWGVHRRLFEGQKSITEENLRDTVKGFAEAEELDVAAFLSCFDEEKTKSVVEADMREAAEMGLASTPTFVINGTAIKGAPALETFSKYIEMASDEAAGE